MKKQTLSEQVSRIKGMIKRVNEEHYEKEDDLNEYSEGFFNKVVDKFKQQAASEVEAYVMRFDEIKNNFPIDKRDINKISFFELKQMVDSYVDGNKKDKLKSLKHQYDTANTLGADMEPTWMKGQRDYEYGKVKDDVMKSQSWKDDFSEGVHTDDEKESYQEFDISQDRKDSLVMQVALNMLLKGEYSVEDIKRLIMNNNHLSDETKLYILKDNKGGDMNEGILDDDKFNNEVKLYNEKIKNSYMVLEYLGKLFNDGQISREVFHDFYDALQGVLKRYHTYMNRRHNGMDDATKKQMRDELTMFRPRERGGEFDDDEMDDITNLK